MPSPSSPRHHGANHRRDREIVEAALAGDPAATDELAARLSSVPAMVRSCHRRLGAPFLEAEVEELVHDTLTRIWTKLASFEGRSTLETWAYGFAVREMLKSLERRRRRPASESLRSEQLHSLPAREVEAPLVDHEEVLIVHEHLEGIGLPASEIIRLRHFEELSFEEIGTRLDSPTNTVKTRYYRGLERLREALRPFWRSASDVR